MARKKSRYQKTSKLLEEILANCDPNLAKAAGSFANRMRTEVTQGAGKLTKSDGNNGKFGKYDPWTLEDPLSMDTEECLNKAPQGKKAKLNVRKRNLNRKK